jgi:Kelch motif/Galactose oxidase, central domain
MRPVATAILATLLTLAAYGQSPSAVPYTWAPVNPALTVPRADACAAALADGSAIVSGGITTDGSALASADRFQTGLGFSLAPAMNNARAAHSCTTLKDGRILVAGGNDGHGNPIGTAEIYDPSDQSWTIVADLLDPRWGHTATLLQNGRILIAGGQDASGPKDTLELFEPKASAFVAVPARLSSPRMNIAAAAFDDPHGNRSLVALMGGQHSDSSASASVDLYDPIRNTIIAAAPLLAARASHSASALADGTLLVAGGWDGTSDLDTIEIYDIEKGSALAISKLTTARHGHFAMTLPGNGSVLLGAGMAGDSPLASCELYSPENGTFTTIGPLGSPRARTTAVPVADGVVLSAGGVSTDGVTPITSTGVLATPSITWNLKGFVHPYQGDLAVHGKNFAAGPVTFSLAILNSSGTSTQTLNSASVAARNFDTVTNDLTTPGRSGKWTLTVRTNGQNVALAQSVVFADVDLQSSCNPCAAPSGVAVVSLTAKITNAEPKLINARPAGAMVAFMDGSTLLGTFPVVASSSAATVTVIVGPGTHVYSASIGANADGFGGTADGFIGQSTPLSVVITRVDPTPTTVAVAVNPSPVLAGNNVTLTSAVSFNQALLPALAQGKAPTGTVTYTPGSQTATVPVGQAASLTAAYSGDSFFRPSSSVAVNLSVTALKQPVTTFYGIVKRGDPFSGLHSLTWTVAPVTSSSLSGAGRIAFVFGSDTWSPVTGDWSGIGRSSVGAFDPTSDTWHLGGPQPWELRNRPPSNSAEPIATRCLQAARRWCLSWEIGLALGAPEWDFSTPGQEPGV